ncbi:MAG TPA: hypothetical protein VKJ65_14100, partial [Phycisphaerae bacterium]|nr:hypothetical protein [Phycisphaerae bacterium]
MKIFLVSLFYVVFVLLNAEQMVAAEQSNELLTNASQVLSLSGEEAWRGIKISIKGVVTAAEPNWGGRFFVQDSSGGV